MKNMTFQRKIKENALLSLKNHWGKAIGIFFFQAGVTAFFLLLEQMLCMVLELTSPESPALVFSLRGRLFEVNSSLAIVTATSALICFAVVSPLRFGAKQWYWEQVSGEKPVLHILFAYFYDWKTLFRVILLRILVGIRLVGWGLLCALPSAGIAAGIWFAGKFAPTGTGVFLLGMLWLVLLAATFLMAVLWYFITRRYFLAEYIFIAEPGAGLHGILKKSVRAMKGGKRILFSLQLSMLGWGILSVLLAPAIFTAPYYQASMAIFAKVRLEQYRRNTMEK